MFKAQNGFSPIFIIVIICIIGVLGAGVYVVSKKPPQEPETQNNTSQELVPVADVAPKLMNLGLSSMDQIEITSNALRDYETRGLKGFYFFGDMLEGNRINPTLEFASVRDGAKVIASIDGEVTFIKEQGSDRAVFLQTDSEADWIIGYDHLVNVVVKQGDRVKAGDVLGEPAVQGNGLKRFEIQINNRGESPEYSYCPTAMLHSEVKARVIDELKTMMLAWNSLAGKNIYDIASQEPLGCSAPKVLP
jgi:hypothetical protein